MVTRVGRNTVDKPIVVTPAELARTAAEEIARRHAQRERELELRAQTIAYWKQRDTKKIAQLKAIWAERDAQMAPIRRQQVFDCTCELCGHPYLMRRPPTPTDKLHCPTCRKFLHRQRERTRYRQQSPHRIAYNQAWKQIARTRRQQARLQNEIESQIAPHSELAERPPEVIESPPMLPEAPTKLLTTPRRKTGPVVVWSPSI